VLSHYLKQCHKVVGVDLFDNYFSQHTDSRFSRLRYWLSSLAPQVDFAMCSTDNMKSVVKQYLPTQPIHVMNDPYSIYEPELIADALDEKLRRVTQTKHIDILWFGIGDNPYFAVGISDLMGYASSLHDLKGHGFEVSLQILTNRRALIPANLGLLRQLPIEYEIEEWSEEREEEYLKDAFLCFLPVNSQSFSVVKSLNRAIACLTFHIDDDLLHVPISLGAGKFNIHNSASRRKTVRYLLDNSDLVYCSTKNIENRMAQLNTTANRTTGDIYCSGEVINNYESKPTTLIGYMASADHAHNLRLILPALIRILDKHPKVNFELFGSMPQPEQLQRFGSRISIAPPIADYTHFLKEFASRKWDVGLCPLVPIPFNKMKAETKWVEYSSCGIAVIASKNTAYDRCCADGCGLLVETEDDWYDAMDTLIVNTEKKSEIVENAQRKITEKYSIDSLRDQVLSIFSIAKTKLEA